MSATAIELLAEVETLPDEWALVVLDRALVAGHCSLRELVAAAHHLPERVQWLVVIADARATSTVQSLIRRAWYRAELPTPTVGRALLTPVGPVITACATDYHRFATATSATAEQRAWLKRLGWHVLVLPENKVLAASGSELAEHLRAEHLQHLGTVGLGQRPTTKPA
ncbi:MAG TPA: hypothetical protein VN108_10720 [Marmoricola sp.]|nr:hypothetical protein [Marmoricola sp.]